MPSLHRPARSVAALLLAVLLLSSCGLAGGSGDAGQGQEMTIEVVLRDIHRCSRISPEIQVSGAPAGTASYEVRLVEYGAEERFLGGGVWPATGDGIIPEGVLTRHYRGPCPPPDTRREYGFRVAALDRESSRPLAVCLYRFSQE